MTMTNKQRSKVISWLMDNNIDYNILVARKMEFKEINRALSDKEMDDYIKINNAIEKMIETYSWIV